MNNKLKFILPMIFVLAFIGIVSGSWTTGVCTLDAPSSDPNINTGQTFFLNVTTGANGTAGGYSSIDITARFCEPGTCSPNTTIPGTGDLSTAGSQPQNCNAPCKNSNVQFTWTVSGDTAGDYTVDGHCVGNDDINSGDQDVTVNVVLNSCSYVSGDWYVACEDFCNNTGAVDLGGSNMVINGTGAFQTTTDIINFGELTIEGTDSSNRCEVTCLGGCFQT